MLHQDTCSGREERLLFLAPGDKCGAAAGLQHAKTFAESFGEVRKEHGAEAAGEDVVGLVRERKGFGAGFAEFDVGDALLASQFFRKGNHARAKIGGDDAAGGSDFRGDGKRGIADAAGEIQDAEARAKLGGLEDGQRCAHAICAKRRRWHPQSTPDAVARGISEFLRDQGHSLVISPRRGSISK